MPPSHKGAAGLNKKQNHKLKFMKATRTLFIAALIAGSLFAGNTALRAADTNTPPSTPPAGGPPPGGPPGGPGMRGRLGFDMTAKQLDLTEDQKPKVKAILDDEVQQMRDLRQDNSLSPDDRRTKMRTARDNTAAKLKDVLTPEQFVKWQKVTQGPGVRRPPPTNTAGSTNAPSPAPSAAPPAVPPQK